MNVLSLFAGIGGLELGLERAGMTTVGQVEIDPFCRQVLAKHWPEVPRHDDVRTAVEWWLRGSVADTAGSGEANESEVAYAEALGGPVAGTSSRIGRGDPAEGVPLMGGTVASGTPNAPTGSSAPRPTVDVICGGFPCQDISNAGRRAGIGGERSGLWTHMARTVRVLRPRYVVMENVSALLVRGLDVVAGDLAEIGYDLQWDCIPAAAVGAPHRRDRWWAIAYPNTSSSGWGSGPRVVGGMGSAELGERTGPQALPDPASDGRGQGGTGRPAGPRTDWEAIGPEALADPNGSRRDGWAGQLRPRGWGQPANSSWWRIEPQLGRVAHGIPRRVDRLRSLGNAVVPQVAEHVGRLVMEFDAQRDVAA